jgi:hypothetical protein
MAQAPRTLLPELEQLLVTRPASVGDAIRKVVTDVRPCVRLETTRASSVPLQGSVFDRLLGRPASAPASALPRLASKFCGLPYVEGVVDFTRAKFIGQITFAEVRAALARDGFPAPPASTRTLKFLGHPNEATP